MTLLPAGQPHAPPGSAPTAVVRFQWRPSQIGVPRTAGKPRHALCFSAEKAKISCFGAISYLPSACSFLACFCPFRALMIDMQLCGNTGLQTTASDPEGHVVSCA